MPKILLLLSLMLVSFEVPANPVMDRVVECNRVAAGALMRLQGFGGNVRWITEAEMGTYHKEGAAPPPKTSMLVRDDGESAQEKLAYDADLMTGWNLEDVHIAKHGGQPKDPKAVLEACMKQRDVSAGRFMVVGSESAQGEDMKNPAISKERDCDFLSEVVERAVPLKGRFDSVEAMLEALPFPDSWSAAFAARAKAEIVGLYGFIGNSREYIKQRNVACKHA